VEASPDSRSKEVTPGQSTEKHSIDSSVQSASEPANSSEKVEDKLAALKSLLSDADLMKLLVDQKILNLSAVKTITSIQPENSQTTESEAPHVKTESCIPVSSVSEGIPEGPTAAESSKNSTEDASSKVEGIQPTSCATIAETSEEVSQPENIPTSVGTEGHVESTTTMDDTPLSKVVKRPKKRGAKRSLRKGLGRSSSTALEASMKVEKEPRRSVEEKQAQPRRRGKNELERLQEDIREMFISAEVVTATGQRTCRVRREAQEQGSKSRNSSSEKSRTESEFDSRSRSRSRGDESSKCLNTSSESNRSVATADAERNADDEPGQRGGDSDDDKPLKVLQKSLDVRSSPDSSPFRPSFKKRKYNLIDSETESEIDDGRVSSCSVVIENLAPLTSAKELTPQRAPSRNVARRGKRTGFANFGNRTISLEEPKQATQSNALSGGVEEVDKSLIDRNNIIVLPDGEVQGKLTRRQLKMRLTDQDVEPSVVPSVRERDNSWSTVDCKASGDSEPVPCKEAEAVTDSDLSAATLVSSETLPTENNDVRGGDAVASHPSSSANADGSHGVYPVPDIKSEPIDCDTPQSQDPLLDSLMKNFVCVNGILDCRHCPWKGRTVVSHYKCAHAEAEVDHARFPIGIAARLYAESEEQGFATISDKDLAAKFPLSKEKGRYLLKCVLCKTKLNPNRFVKHFSLHTGEYDYWCSSCAFKAPSREAVAEHFSSDHPGKKVQIEHVVRAKMSPLNVLLVHACSLCNFFQIQKQSVENHIRLAHPTDKTCLIRRVAVTELVDNQATTSSMRDSGAAAGTSSASGTEGAPGDTSEATKEIESQVGNSPATAESSHLLSDHPQSSPVNETHSSSPAETHPEVSVSSQSSATPAVSASEDSTAPDVAERSIDLSVFMTSDQLKSKEQQIEEERLQKLKDAGETLRDRLIKPRTSILDRIVERFRAPEDSPAPLETAPVMPDAVESTSQGFSPLPSLRATAARRANKSLQLMGQPTDSERKNLRQLMSKSQDTASEGLDVNPPVNLPSLSAGELNSTVELMRKKIESPIIVRNKSVATGQPFPNSSVVDDTITAATVFKMRDPSLTSVQVGDVDVRPGSDKDPLYYCRGEGCTFLTSLPKMFLDHIASAHHRWRVRLKCR